MKSQISKPFDPNFEALLHEAAADPHSILLRVRRPEIFPALRRREPAVSVAMAGLSNVERELLASYRCELGFLLRQAIVAILLAGTDENDWIDASIEDDRSHVVVDERVWRWDASRLVGRKPSTSCEDVENVLALVPDLTEKGFASGNVLQLAAAALRVEPVDQTRIYAGTYLATLGDTARCLEVSSTVLDGLATPSNEAYAREGIALGLGRAGRFAEAGDAVLGAQRLNLARPEIPLRYLFYSSLSANRNSILNASAWIANTLDETNAAIDRFCTDVRRKLSRRQWTFDVETLSSIRQNRRQLDPISIRVLDEITGPNEIA